MADAEIHKCECGFTWVHGKNGSHNCGPYYRARITEIESQLAARDEVEGDSIDNVIDLIDIRVDTFIPGGGGGWIAKHDSGVRITHVPSGIVVEHSGERSQHRNKAIAFGLLQLELNKPKTPIVINEWKKAVDDQLILIESTADSFLTPDLAVKALLDWHAQVAGEQLKDLVEIIDSILDLLRRQHKMHSYEVINELTGIIGSAVHSYAYSTQNGKSA